MTAVDDALDRLEEAVEVWVRDVETRNAALDDAATVRDELQRLRDERDGLLKAVDGMARAPYGEYAQAHERAVAAEAEVRQLREDLAAVGTTQQEAYDAACLRADEAEEIVRRLTEGLREIVKEYDLWSEDANNGEFRLWDLDRLCMNIVKARALLADSPDGADEWFIPEGDRVCGVVHRDARATCMKRRGHDGPHATPQGTWIDGPWCEYPDGAKPEGGEA